MYIYISNELSTPTSLALYIKDLEYSEIEYEGMFIAINGYKVDITKLNSEERVSGIAIFNGLSPSYPYEVHGYVKREGEWKEVAGATFVTPSADFGDARPLPNYSFGMKLDMPSQPKTEKLSVGLRSMSLLAAAPTSYTPTFYPRVQEQWIYGNGGWYIEGDTCVAATLTCVKEIHHYRRTGKIVYYANWWVYGNRSSHHWQQDGMYPNEALDKLRSDGVITGGALIGNNSNLPYHDFYHNGGSMQGAKSKVQSSYSSNISTARENSLSGWSEVSNIETIKNSIIENGSAVVWLFLFQEFYSTPSSGMVPNYTSANPYTHTMAIIGWRVINGTTYWICQNSWWSTWGDGGRCYMPINHGSIYKYYTMEDNSVSPSPLRGLSGVPSTSSFTIYLYWLESTNTARYRINYRIKGSDTWIEHGTTTFTSYSVTGLAGSTAYEFKVYAQNGGGNGDPAELVGNNAITTMSAVGALTYMNVTASTLTKGRISVYWTAVTGATGYRVEVYLGNTTAAAALVSSQNVSSGTDATVDGLLEYRLYTVKVFGTRSGSTNGGFLTQTITTTDLTPPEISFLGMSGLGSLQLSWLATDSGIGLRTNNRYRVYVGTKDGSASTLTANDWTNSSNYSWTTDANGKPLFVNSYYWVGVRAYDANGNESTLFSQRIQYKIVRPQNWSWDTPKIKGQNTNITATEWNDFCLRVSEFKVYITGETFTFTSAVKGQPIMATQGNQVRSEIAGMGAAVPTAASTTTEVNASFLNALVTSLNSIQ